METVKERRSHALHAHRTGALDEAARLYHEILADSPGDGETWHYLSVLCGQQGRHAQALRCCAEALRCGYATAAVHANRAFAHRALDDPEPARQAFHESLRIDPDDVGLTLELFDLLRSLGEEKEALCLVQDAARRFPGSSAVWTGLGQLAADLNLGRTSEEAFFSAAQVDPGSAASWLNLGNVRQMRGDAAGAEQAYRRTIDIDPASDRAFWHLAQLVPPDRDPRLAREIVARATPIESARSAAILFAAGKVHHETGRADSAFAAFDAGNRRVRSGYRYSPAADIAAMRSLAASLDATAAPIAAEADAPKLPRPVFIVGMPRSGSTLIEQMLAQHPAIAAGGEIVWLQRHVRNALRSAGLSYPADQLRLGDEQLAELRRRYRRALEIRARNKALVTDKLPANFLCIPVIRRIFPDALVVHVRREPLETCWSCYRQLFTGPQQFAYDLAELGRYYRAAAAFIESCRLRWPEQVTHLSYEAVISNPETQLKELLRRLELDWDSHCLRPDLTSDVVMTASAVQLRGGLARAPRRSADAYARQLAPLRSALVR